MKGNSTAFIILSLLFVLTGLSFLDRQVLSMTIIKIQREFDFTDVQYGFVNTSFLISYAIMFTLGGRLMDKIGSKAGLAISVAIWSVAICLHGIMSSFIQLMAFRFLLGVGEGGCFPGAAKAVYEWFDEKRRGLANGIAIGGSAIGAVVAPPLTILISSHYGWRWSFVIPGLIGILWVIIWLGMPWGTRRQNVPGTKARTVKNKLSFLTILKNKEARTLVLIRFMLDPVLYFIMFWTPKYLHEQRHVSFEKIGHLFWIPFLGLGIANIMGGWCSDRLVRNGFSINRARKTVMGIAAVFTIVAPFISWVSTVGLAITLLTVIMIAHGFWITNYITATSDIFGSEATATVVGISGTAGAISGLLVNPFVGLIVQHYSYQGLWFASGIMYPLAFILLMILIPRIKPLNVKQVFADSLRMAPEKQTP